MAAATAVATVGGAILSASLQVLFDRMASRQFLNFLHGIKRTDAELLSKLKRKLRAVGAVLNDAEAKQISNSAVKDWMDDVKDAVHDAEDLMDDITEDLRRNMESNSQVRTILSSIYEQCFGSFKGRVENITGILEALAHEKDSIGLKEGTGEKMSGRGTTSMVDLSKVRPRTGIEDKIVEFLLSQSTSADKVSVCALVGLGGIGKTTLARVVYNHKEVKHYYHRRAWVCVSDEFDPVRMIKTILNSLNNKTPEHDDLNLLQQELAKKLRNKKFLLVLDDVWNENYATWETLQMPLNLEPMTSKIIVTTRSDKVALVMRSVQIHHLEPLCFDDCWIIFKKHAFRNGDSDSHPKLEEIGKEIVRKCKGLPLAAKTLGAALYSELQLKEWENVRDSDIWDLPNDEILPALRLSYGHLSPQLKRCFAYCSIFPKDYEIAKETLILLWMAEGFLEKSEDIKAKEDIGSAYFNELLSRSFFQKSPTHKSFFVMHDLINDLARHVSGKSCVRLKDDEVSEIPGKLRHLSYIRSKKDNLKRFKTIENVNGLRTFLPLNFGWPMYNMIDFDKVSRNICPSCRSGYPSPPFMLSNRVWNDLLDKAKYLRVLSLRHYRIKDLPNNIGELKHLRYLDLSHTSIQRLPDSICNLYNLQTLLLSFCYKLVELPTMMSHLIGLRHLDTRHSKVEEMPSEMGKLKSLQKLTNYDVGKTRGKGVEELRELSLGGILRIKELQNVADSTDASGADLVGKQHLNDLRLEWNEDLGVQQDEAEIVLQKLQPHSNVERLTIQGYGGTSFPDWLAGPAFLINIVSLRLWSCKKVSAFPPLGQLPSLKHLYITGAEEVVTVGAEFYGTAGSPSTKPSFVSLKALSFGCLPKWEKWLCLEGQGQGPGGYFPCLEELYIENCPMLTGDLPDELPLLTRLEIKECKKLVAPLPKVPAIHQLDASYSTSYGGGVVLRNAPNDSMCLQRSISQRSVQLQKTSIDNADNMESRMEEGIWQSNNNLQDLRIRDCCFSTTRVGGRWPDALKSLCIEGAKNLHFFLSDSVQLPGLETLVISKGTFHSPSSFPLSSFPRLTHLHIKRLQGLESLSFTISEVAPASFNQLLIKGCGNLVSIVMPALRFATCFIFNCKNLKSLSHDTSSFQSLTLLHCPELTFPIQDLPSSLTSLTIVKCNQLTSQMEQGLQDMASLRHFSIQYGCEDLEHFPKACLLPSTLTSLDISYLPNLMSLDSQGLQLLTTLQKLNIRDCPNLYSLKEESLPSTLISLYLSGLPNLKSLDTRALQLRTTVKEINIRDCPNLQSFTQDGLPTSLTSLSVKNCPLLRDKWVPENRQHIAHIETVIIDDQLLT